MDKDSELIVQALQSGNDDLALKLLYKSALPTIVKYITKNQGDAEEAKDVFQDTVVSLYQVIKLGKYDPSRDIQAYAFFIARNLWINRITRKKRNIGMAPLEFKQSEDSPHMDLVTEEQQSAVTALIEKVGNPCREILRFVMYEKLSMKQIAEKMGMSGETVAKSTHYKCKHKLAALIYKNKNLLALLKDERRSY